uniref:Proteasome subunit alpha type n=1 Tax=Panagrolaimus sp. ES5 TaxID=591445 RepID=A0AC34FPL9_9BILA
MERYDRAITIFSPDGHLFQVEYAQEAVKKGSSVVAIKGKDCVVLGVEKKSMETLQDERTVRKIFNIDEHVMLGFAGLTADARVLIDAARVECQSHRLNLEDPVTVGYISRFIANTKQRYTQSPGRRPFGLSMLIAYYEYLASSTGRGEKPIREYLEEHYTEDNIKDEDSVLKLVIRSLSQVVQSGAQNIEIAVMKIGKTRKLVIEEVEGLLKVVEEERAAAEAQETAKKKPMQQQ